uniref:Uncharacterized protein n=1 Tax=Arundo donax TaxID=35708 RepID=A0A0A9HQK7_ARUDO
MEDLSMKSLSHTAWISDKFIWLTVSASRPSTHPAAVLSSLLVLHFLKTLQKPPEVLPSS